jgi:hypothetical protein
MDPNVKIIEDPTNGSLEAALLDQYIAGIFFQKPYAYVPVLHGDEFAIGIAVEGEPGYNLLDAKQFRWVSYDVAYNFCMGMNQHIGLTEDQAVRLIADTMRPVSARWRA